MTSIEKFYTIELLIVSISVKFQILRLKFGGKVADFMIFKCIKKTKTSR